MSKLDWVLIKKVYSHAEAEVIKGMLEAQDVVVLLAQEGAAKAIGLNVGALGEIQIHVKSTDESAAREILNDFLHGNLEE